MRWRWAGTLTLLLLFGLRVVVMQVFIFYVVLVVPGSGGQDCTLEKSTMVLGSLTGHAIYGTGALRTGTKSFSLYFQYNIFQCHFLNKA